MKGAFAEVELEEILFQSLIEAKELLTLLSESKSTLHDEDSLL